MLFLFAFFFFQAEDGIRDLVRSRGLGDVYKRQETYVTHELKSYTDYVSGEPLAYWRSKSGFEVDYLSLIHI